MEVAAVPGAVWFAKQAVIVGGGCGVLKLCLELAKGERAQYVMNNDDGDEEGDAEEGDDDEDE